MREDFGFPEGEAIRLRDPIGFSAAVSHDEPEPPVTKQFANSFGVKVACLSGADWAPIIP